MKEFQVIDLLFSKQNNNFVVRQAFTRFYHGFLWSEKNVVLNYFPTQDGVWVLVCPLIVFGI